MRRAALGIALLGLLGAGDVLGSPQNETFHEDTCLPPKTGTYRKKLVTFHNRFQGHQVDYNFDQGRHKKFRNCQPPGPQESVHTFPSTIAALVSISGGPPFPMSAPAMCTVVMTFTGNVGGVDTYSTEMVQLDIAAGSLPPGQMLRESPTLASTGATTIRPVPGGFMISSFFDIFLEATADGGLTWVPAFGPAHMDLSATNVDIVFSSKNTLEWLETDPAETYDVASRLVSVNPALNTWNGPGGIFDAMPCRATSIACVDTDADGQCEFNTAGIDAPTRAAFAVWLVRERGSSWDEGGEKNAVGNWTSRDLDMIDASPTCP